MPPQSQNVRSDTVAPSGLKKRVADVEPVEHPHRAEVAVGQDRLRRRLVR